jgi:hypothetical protein
MAWLSCYRFRSNQVPLALTLLAYNPGNSWRRLRLPKTDRELVADELKQPLAKTGGRLAKHARYYSLFLAQGHLNRRRFCGDARPDRGAASTDGMDSSPVRSGICLQRGY